MDDTVTWCGLLLGPTRHMLLCSGQHILYATTFTRIFLLVLVTKMAMLLIFTSKSQQSGFFSSSFSGELSFSLKTKTWCLVQILNATGPRPYHSWNGRQRSARHKTNEATTGFGGQDTAVVTCLSHSLWLETLHSTWRVILQIFTHLNTEVVQHLTSNITQYLHTLGGTIPDNTDVKITRKTTCATSIITDAFSDYKNVNLDFTMVTIFQVYAAWYVLLKTGRQNPS